jgi:pimeloyl-ACP methyl ester carboxylesterase
MQMYVREFDFAVADIKMPIDFFHGESDANVPLPLIQRVVRELPNARLITYPNEAHLSTLCNHIEEIAAALRG